MCVPRHGQYVQVAGRQQCPVTWRKMDACACLMGREGDCPSSEVQVSFPASCKVRKPPRCLLFLYRESDEMEGGREQFHPKEEQFILFLLFWGGK